MSEEKVIAGKLHDNTDKSTEERKKIIEQGVEHEILSDINCQESTVPDYLPFEELSKLSDKQIRELVCSPEFMWKPYKKLFEEGRIKIIDLAQQLNMSSKSVNDQLKADIQTIDALKRQVQYLEKELENGPITKAISIGTKLDNYCQYKEELLSEIRKAMSL